MKIPSLAVTAGLFGMAIVALLVDVSTGFVTTPSSSQSLSPVTTMLAARRKSASSDGNDDDTQKNAAASSSMDSAKKAALDGVLNRIERSYGRGSIVRLGDDDAHNLDVTCLATGAMTLDAATGGGYPRGRVVEIYGPESSGKTTLALHAIASAQRLNGGQGAAAFIDAEHALDPAYAAACGVDVPNLFVCQPDSGEMALDVVDQLVRSAAVDIIVVDSVAALVPRAELEGDMSDAQIGLQARLMSKALRKITGSLARSGSATVLFINQLRSKVGVIYGSPEVTAGGNALKYYASLRLDTRRKEILPENAGIRIKVKVVKNKVAAPFRVVNLDILFNSGIDSLGCTLDCATDLDLIERRGSWYAYRGRQLAQGRQNALEVLRADANLAQHIEDEVRATLFEEQQRATVAQMGGGGAAVETEVEEEETVGSARVVANVEEESEEEAYLS